MQVPYIPALRLVSFVADLGRESTGDGKLSKTVAPLGSRVTLNITGRSVGAQKAAIILTTSRSFSRVTLCTLLG